MAQRAGPRRVFSVPFLAVAACLLVSCGVPAPSSPLSASRDASLQIDVSRGESPEMLVAATGLRVADLARHSASQVDRVVRQVEAEHSLEGSAGVRTASLQVGDGPTEPDAPVVSWVATHREAVLWGGEEPDAARLARLPSGSFFAITGEPVGERIPVRYSGSSILPATDGWLDAADVGPIPPPPTDWAQPTFPPRQIVRGVRSEVVRGDPSIPLIALTFDAGADIGDTLVLLQALRALEVRATFFITGQFADRYPDVIRMIAEDGHELANHSYSHPDFAKLSESAMRSEIQRATASIESASGVKVAPLWRPPFGSRNNRILQIVEEEGFLPIYWTFDSGDWLPNATTEKVLDTDLRLASNGAIVVHHVQPRATALAIPTVIQELRDRGFDFVTVSDLLGPTAVSR